MKKVTHEEFLGVSPDATPEEADRHCQALLDWLSDQEVPPALQGWMKTQRSIIGEMRGELVQAGAAASGRQGATSPSFLSRLLVRRSVLTALGVFIGLLVVVGWQARGLIGERLSQGDAAAQAPEEEFDPKAFLESHQSRITDLKATLSANPQDATALFDIGETYMLGEEWQSAIDWFTKLLAVDPTNVHAMVDIGTANMNLGRPAESEAAYQKALIADPASPQVHYNLGFLYAFRRVPVDADQGVVHWQEVVRLSPGSNLASSAEVHIAQAKAAQLAP